MNERTVQLVSHGFIAGSVVLSGNYFKSVCLPVEAVCRTLGSGGRRSKGVALRGCEFILNSVGGFVWSKKRSNKCF